VSLNFRAPSRCCGARPGTERTSRNWGGWATGPHCSLSEIAPELCLGQPPKEYWGSACQTTRLKGGERSFPKLTFRGRVSMDMKP